MWTAVLGPLMTTVGRAMLMREKERAFMVHVGLRFMSCYRVDVFEIVSIDLLLKSENPCK